MFMLKRSAAFTLIELMVVVAIIAILSTMGVANFSTAIKRSRNAVRQNDMMAVSKGLETCYDVMGAVYLKDKYGGDTCSSSDVIESTFAGGAAGVFKADVTGKQDCQNRCLNADIVPAVDDYGYTGVVNKNADKVQKYIVCAQLEQVGNWESIGNSAKDLTGDPIDEAIVKLANKKDNGCKPDSRKCFFCVAAQQ